MKKQNLILIGFMATGKSTVGRLLAKETERRFVDMDALIEKREQRTINDIFATDGEPHFRAIESALAKELAQETGLVIATGGGIVINPANIEALGATGKLACLTAETDELIRRVTSCSSRPLLATNKEQQVRTLLENRKPLYDAIPFQVATDRRSPKEIAAIILREFQP